jgi:hypothetical protein
MNCKGDDGSWLQLMYEYNNQPSPNCDCAYRQMK